MAENLIQARKARQEKVNAKEDYSAVDVDDDILEELAAINKSKGKPPSPF